MVLKNAKDAANQQGAVTVAALLLLAAVLGLFLAIYNYALYALAVQRLENGLWASANAVLAGYDGNLMRELGLFALEDQNQLAQEGRRYLLDNLNGKGKPLKIELLEYSLILDRQSSLGLPAVLESQIFRQEIHDGWLSLGREILEFLNVNLRPGHGEIEPDPQVPPDSSWSWKNWAANLRLEENQFQETAKTGLSLWQLLAPWTPEGWEKNRLDPPKPAWDQAQVAAELGQRLEQGLGEDQGLMNFGAAFKARLQAGLAAGRNRLLQGAYILEQCDYATAKALRQRYFAKAEVEYILWGHGVSWDNIRETAFNVFLLRALLHTAHEFSQAPSGDLRIQMAKAFMLGLERGKQEVEALFAGEKISAFPAQPKYRVSYGDHLRLFLLLQSPKEQLQRLQVLLAANLDFWQEISPEQKPGKARANLANYYTKIQIGAKVKLKLWPIGGVILERRGVEGYDLPFAWQ